MSRPFFTIITATYNAATFLASLAESLATQTYRDFIWVVQDGGSTDQTLALIEAWRTRLPAISLECAPDAGIYDAWNKALLRHYADLGNWVLFLGADDALASAEALANARTALAKAPQQVLLASGSARIIGQTGVEIMPGFAGSVRARLHYDMPFCHTALFHHFSLFKTMRFDTRYRVLGDYDFVCRSVQQDDQTQILPYVITSMRRGGISSTLAMQPAIFKESCTIAWRNFGKLQFHHAKVGVKVLIVAALCRLLGTAQAERTIDALRHARGKSPIWYNPLPPTSPIKAINCAVILVNYNNYADTLACLVALMRLTTAPAHIVVVDNGSCTEDVEALHSGWSALCRAQKSTAPQVLSGHDKGFLCMPTHALICLKQNLGFSGGNNVALRMLLQHSDCDAFWLLNNDTEVDPNALDTLCARLNTDRKIGICGSTLMYAHSPDRVQTAGGASCSLFTGRTAFLCAEYSLAEVLRQGESTQEYHMDYIVGASCLVRRDVLKRVGFMPEEYFLYYEDVAFSLNIQRAGYKMGWAQNSIVLHKEGASTKASGGGAGREASRSLCMDYLSLRNRIALIRTFRPWALPMVLVSLLGVYINRLQRGQGKRFMLILRAAWDGLTGRMGPPPSALK